MWLTSESSSYERFFTLYIAMALEAVTASALLTSLWINVVTSVVFLTTYMILKNLPFFVRVYYPRRYLKGRVEHVDDLRDKKPHKGGWRSYLRIWNWIKSIWRKLNLTDNSEFIERYGLDSAVLVRTFLLGYASHIKVLCNFSLNYNSLLDGCANLNYFEDDNC